VGSDNSEEGYPVGGEAEARRKPRAPAKSFEELVVWQKAHAFVLAVYRLTEGFPRHEVFGLTSQLRRAVVSVPANIAEGSRKRGDAEKARFFNTAQGSLEECRYYLILARDLRYTTGEGLLAQLEEVSRLLESYASAVRLSRSARPRE
jgi:four helix bundle protein